MSAAADWAATWCTTPVQVSRRTGMTSRGVPALEAAVTVLGHVVPGVDRVTDPDGVEHTVVATVQLPSGTEWVPVGSVVTLPATHGGTTGVVARCQILATAVGTPDHVALSLTGDWPVGLT